jgi:hypothetical protein
MLHHQTAWRSLGSRKRSAPRFVLGPPAWLYIELRATLSNACLWTTCQGHCSTTLSKLPLRTASITNTSRSKLYLRTACLVIGSHNDPIQALSSTNHSAHLFKGIVRKLSAVRARKHAGDREVCAASHIISNQKHLGSLLEVEGRWTTTVFNPERLGMQRWLGTTNN